jgi:hypothetical protein
LGIIFQNRDGGAGMLIPLTGLGIAGLAGFAAFAGLAWRRASRERYIRQFILPQGLFKKLKDRRPEVDAKYHSLIAQGLRQFFLCYLKSGRQFVSMPSQAVDDLWHEFILYTRDYQQFCSKAFGGYMHHVPAVALGRGQSDDAGLRRTWRHACQEENINPKAPARLPLLFAIDAKLGVAGGFRYLPDCSKRKTEHGDVHCGADIGASCGGGASDSGGSWFSSDSGSDASDAGGSSCGGGGCGGGGD